MTNSKLEAIKNFVKKKTSKSQDPQHGWDHLERVANYALNIVKSLKLENKLDLNLLLAACYLHDINNTFHSPGIVSYFLERKRLKLVLPTILSGLDIDQNEMKIIENVIYASPFSFPFKKLNKGKDLYTRILQDADTLDFFSKIREIGFRKAAKNFNFYAFWGLFANRALKYGRSNLKNYLNFPELAEELYVQKN